jgi:hypothetical protein
MTPKDIRSTRTLAARSREEPQKAALMDWLSPPITFSRTKRERLLNPPLQKSQESCDANRAPRRFVAAKTRGLDME